MFFFHNSPKNPINKIVKFYFLMTSHFRTLSARDVTAAIFFEKKFYWPPTWPPYHVVQTKNWCGHTVQSHGTLLPREMPFTVVRGAWLPWRPLVKINRQKLGLFHGGSPWTSSTKRSMDRGSMCCIRPIIDMLRKFAVKQSEEARSIPVFPVFAVKFMNIDMSRHWGQAFSSSIALWFLSFLLVLEIG